MSSIIKIYLIGITGLLFMVATGCKKEEKIPEVPAEIATLKTDTITATSTTTATCGGTVTSDGRSAVTARGVCWSTTQTPTIDNNKTTDGTGAGSFISTITGLKPGSVYYFRAYATNSLGTNYGAVMPLTTQGAATGTVTDNQGNVYKTVIIGTQTWMAENLKVTRFNNGDVINTTPNPYAELYGPYLPYQWAYDGYAKFADTYGRLYTYVAITDTRGICPAGWHVATYSEWLTLIAYLGKATTAADKLKEPGNAHWRDPRNKSTNQSGFTALPGGMRGDKGEFYLYETNGYWWCATQTDVNTARFVTMSDVSNDISTGSAYFYAGYSIRCIKD